MELQEIVRKFWRERRLFASVLLGAVFLGVLWQRLQPVGYEATLLLNIGRTVADESAEYDYESFYRLQADERFADTVVRWLQSPRVSSDIFREAGIAVAADREAELAGVFVARRLSSQMIEVRVARPRAETLRALSKASVVVLNRYAESLNRDRPKDGWFTVIGSEPVIDDARTSFRMALLGASLAGAFVGIWVVAFRIAWSGGRNRKESAS